MRKRLTRFSACFLPAACLLTAFFGQTETVRWVLSAYVPAQWMTLFAADAFRRTAGSEPSRERLRGSWTTAFICTIAGTGLLTWLDWKSGGAGAGLLGGTLCLQALLCEHLRANAQDFSAAMCDFLTATLLGAAMLLQLGDASNLWCVAAAGVGLLIAVLAGFAIGGNPFGRPRVRVCFEMPAAAFKKGVFFLPALAILTLGTGNADAKTMGFCAGWAIFSLSGSTFRRDRSETAELNLWLLVWMALSVVAAAWLPDSIAAPSSVRTLLAPVWLACICALLIHAAPSARTFLGAILGASGAACSFAPLGIAGWTLTQQTAGWIAAGLGLLILSLIVPDFMEIHRRRRALKRRR